MFSGCWGDHEIEFANRFYVQQVPFGCVHTHTIIAKAVLDARKISGILITRGDKDFWKKKKNRINYRVHVICVAKTNLRADKVYGN